MNLSLKAILAKERQRDGLFRISIHAKLNYPRNRLRRGEKGSQGGREGGRGESSLRLRELGLSQSMTLIGHCSTVLKPLSGTLFRHGIGLIRICAEVWAGASLGAIDRCFRTHSNSCPHVAVCTWSYWPTFDRCWPSMTGDNWTSPTERPYFP